MQLCSCSDYYADKNCETGRNLFRKWSLIASIDGTIPQAFYALSDETQKAILKDRSAACDAYQNHVKQSKALR